VTHVQANERCQEGAALCEAECSLSFGPGMVALLHDKMEWQGYPKARGTTSTRTHQGSLGVGPYGVALVTGIGLFLDCAEGAHSGSDSMPPMGQGLVGTDGSSPL